MDTITTPAAVQSPPENSIQHTAQVSLTSRSPASVVHLVQYDTTVPIIAVVMTANGQPYAVPTGAAVNVHLAKPDGTYVYNPAYGLSEDRQTVYIAVTVQMTVCSGKISPVVEVVVDGGTAATGFFVLDIDPNPIPEDAIASTDEYKTIQQLAAEVTVAAQIVTENEAAIQAIGENLTAIQNAPTAAANAAASATLAESWAVGGTGTRPGENTNNAEYWAQQAQAVAQGQLGWFATEQALESAHPTGQNGQWAIIGSTDTIWTWDSDTAAWVDTGDQVDLSDYYTKIQADSAFAPKSHASTLATYGTGSSAVYGHVKLSDTPGTSGVYDGTAATPKCVQDAIAAAIQQLQATMAYQPGDTISFDDVAISGFLTTSGTHMYFMFPLDKSPSDTVSSATVVSGTFVVRGVNGYVDGNGQNELSNYSLTVPFIGKSCISLAIMKSSAFSDGVNNTPVSAYFENVVFQFS